MKSEDQNTIRINKYLSSAGVCSRRDADRLTEAGRVTVNGKKIGTGERIPVDAVICLDGKPVRRRKNGRSCCFFINHGESSAARRNSGSETTVTEYIDYPTRIYPVGRLDKDSEGLLLMTNQGDLVNRIMRAGNYHEKEYQVTVDHEITDEFVCHMQSGVPILGTVTQTHASCRKTGQE